MKIKDILKGKGSNIYSVGPNQTVQEAIRILNDHKIGSLLVTESEKVVGIITERDVLKECGRAPQLLNQTFVQDVMSKELIICSPEDDVDYIMGVMTDKHIRHLPIIEKGKLAGMISIGDIVKSQLHESVHEIKYLRDYIMGTRV